MTVEMIEALSQAPVILILIYLIIRMQGEKEKLITAMVDIERGHDQQLMDIIIRYAPPPTPPQVEQN